MKGIFVLMVGVFACATATPVMAGTLYKCVGADGVPAYVSRQMPAARCEVVSRYRPVPDVPRRGATVVAVQEVPRATARVESVAASRSSPLPPQRTVKGQVYSYMKDGVRHYASRPPAGRVSQVRTIAYTVIERCFACAADNRVNFGAVRLNTRSYQEEIATASRRFGVDEALVRAVIHAESSFNPTAVSHAGAQGLMQLMPATARRFGVADSFDVAQNIQGGVQYLSWLLRRFNGDITLATAGYNAGEGAVDRHGGVPPYRETQHYVQRVAQLMERYRKEVVPSAG